MKNFLVLFLVAAIAGCASGARPPLAAPNAGSAATSNARHARATLSLRIKVPAKRRARRGHYISAGTKGLTLAFTGASNFNTSVGLTPGSPGCSGVPVVCSVALQLSSGSYTVAVDALDAAPVNGTIPPGANVLSTAAGIPLVVKPAANNVFAVMLDGVPATIVVNGFPNATAGTSFSHQPFSVTVSDADGYTIVGTYSTPILLSDGDTSGATTIATSGADTPPALRLLSSSDTATIDYTGAAIPGALVSASTRGANGSGYLAIHGLVYVVDQLQQVLTVMAENCSSAACVNTVAGGISLPGGVAIDAPGNLYVTYGGGSTIIKIPGGCTTSACEVNLGGGFDANGMDAIGPAGAIIATDFGKHLVESVPADCLSAACVTTLGGGFSEPVGVATDSSGNVYVADMSATTVLEIPSGCATAACVTSIGGGFAQPTAVAVDSAGNVYVDDYSNSAVKEIPPGCTSSSCVTTIGGGFEYPMGLTVDASGAVIVGDTGNGKVKKVPPGCVTSACVVTLGGGWGSVLGVAAY
jgi:large repetitive protein